MKSYGTIDHRNGKWVIEAQPHIVIRMKRLFPKIGKQQHGKIWLPDNLETCRELAWFRQRYPLTCSTPRVERWLTKRADQHQEQETVVAQLLAGRRVPQAFQLAKPPREYQTIAANVALTTGGLLLADELGLGKTVSGICVLTDPRTRPALVVAPTHLQRHWREKLTEFAPELRTHIIKRGAPYDLTRTRGTRPGQRMLTPELPDVLICTYHKLHSWTETLQDVIKSVVFDEVQEGRRGAKSLKGAAMQFVARNVDFRLGLSATPIHNLGGEIWNVLECIRPGALGTVSEFRGEWCVGGGDDEEQGTTDKAPRIKDPKAFGSYLNDAGLMIRRTRREVGREIPSLTKVPHHIDCDNQPLEDVESAAMELARIILAKDETFRGERLQASQDLSWQLRQATGLAKAPHVAEFVRMVLEGGEEKVILSGWHRSVFDIWLHALREFKPVMFTGSESPAQKDKSREAFVRGDARVLIMSLRSGSGLDGLQTVCRTIVHGELDWSPAVHEQLDGRPHRDGQTDPVTAYYLITDSGSDPIVSETLGLKREQLEGIRDPGGRDVLAHVDHSGANAKRMAEAYLRKLGKVATDVKRTVELGAQA